MHEDIRGRLLDGEEAQIVLTMRMFHKDGDICGRRVAEIRFRRESRRWAVKPDLLMVANTDDGPDDYATVLGGISRWLEAGRNTDNEAKD